jgi:hypothetical protein
MRLKTHLSVLIAVAALSVAVPVSSAITSAQTGGGYDLTWSTIDGGGGGSEGGGYTVVGTMGQPDAGVLTGGGYTLSGGFWPGAGGPYRIYLPLVMKG